MLRDLGGGSVNKRLSARRLARFWSHCELGMHAVAEWAAARQEHRHHRQGEAGRVERSQQTWRAPWLNGDRLPMPVELPARRMTPAGRMSVGGR